MPMTGNSSEKIDPAHWVAVGGGAIMLAVVGLCSIALWLPWWTERLEEPGRKELTEVSLWNMYTRIELAADDSTLDCERQCDFTKIGSAKVRSTKTEWAEVCDPEQHAGPISENCTKIWVIRVFTLVVWFLAILYSAFSLLNFCGAGLPASVRIPPGIKIILAVCCVLLASVALIVAIICDIRLRPEPPGTEPAEIEPAIPKLSPNGLGFVAVCASVFLSMAGVLAAYLGAAVLHALEFTNDLEHGKPIADPVTTEAPDLSHQVGSAPGKGHEDHDKPKDWRPPPQPLGCWMKGSGTGGVAGWEEVKHW